MLGSVVGGAYFVALRVRKLALDGVRRPFAGFVEKRRCHPPEAVRGHLAALVTEITQRCADCVLAHWARRRAAGKEIFGRSSQRVQFAKNCDRLPRERNQVLASSFHPLGRNPPEGIVEIDLAPFRFANLSWPREGQRCEFEGASHDERALIAVDGADQSSHVSGFGQGAEVALALWRQCATQIRARVPRYSSGCDRISENLPANLFDAMSGRDGAASLDASQHFE